MKRSSSLLRTHGAVNRVALISLGLLAVFGGFGLDRHEGKAAMTASADERVTMSQNEASEPTAPQPPMPEPRDAEIAIREQYDAAVAEGSVAALGVFIDRYPDHPLAAAAKEQISRLKAAGVDR